MPNPRIIPARIIQAREEMGWSPADLARKTGLSQPSIWALENGKTKDPKHETIWKIASATGKHFAFFTGQHDGNTTSEPPVHYSSRVPLISWVQAGSKNPVSDPYPPGSAEEWEDVTLFLVYFLSSPY